MDALRSGGRRPSRGPRAALRPAARATLLALALVAAVPGVGCVRRGAEVAVHEAGEELPGGATTNTLMMGPNAFSLPAENIGEVNERLFFSGNSFFNQSWVQAPASTGHRDGLGPLFNARSCAACHFKDGRGRPPREPGEPFVGLLLRLSVPGRGPHGGPVPEPTYGLQLQPFSLPGVRAEGNPTLRVEEVRGSFPDGEAWTLLSPSYAIEDPAYGPLADDVRISPRVAPAVIGLGLLEAIPEERLLELADPGDRDGDGVSGVVQRVWDPVSGAPVVGRFGWKAEQPTVAHQTVAALHGDMGITSDGRPRQDCTDRQADCLAAVAGGDPEIPDRILARLATYSRLLAVPARQRFDDPEVLRGKALFRRVGCDSCHVPSHRTAADADLPEVRDQVIWPYTDLLLHDMGEGLADDRPTWNADGREWRTPPLWGLRLVPDVNGHDRLLHDGRARGVVEAILWHGGEAEAARRRFTELPAADRRLLVEFVESL